MGFKSFMIICIFPRVHYNDRERCSFRLCSFNFTANLTTHQTQKSRTKDNNAVYIILCVGGRVAEDDYVVLVEQRAVAGNLNSIIIFLSFHG